MNHSATRPEVLRLLDALTSGHLSEANMEELRHIAEDSAMRQEAGTCLGSLLSADSLTQAQRHAALLAANALQYPAFYRASFLELDITPPLSPTQPLALAGFAGPARIAEEIHSPLFLQLLLIEDRTGSKTLIAAADLFGFGTELVSTIRKTAGAWGIPPEAVILNASHTHYAPGTVENVSPTIGHYHRAYAGRLATAVESMLPGLYEALSPCFIYAGEAEAQIGANRRSLVDGQVEFAPNPDGYYHTRTPILVLDFLNSGDSVVVTSHGCHPTSQGGRSVISAGYPGQLRTFVKDFGMVDSVLFLQGAAGSSKPTMIGDEARFADTAEDVAGNALLLAESIIPVVAGPLRPVVGEIFARTELLALPFEAQPTSDSYRRISDDARYPSCLQSWARHFAEKEPGEVPAALDLEVQFVALDDRTCFLTMPGEPVAELARDIFERTDLPGSAFFLGYTNGLKAYLPTAAMLEEGGYESTSCVPTFMLPAKLARSSEKLLIDAVARLIEEWKREDTPNGHGRYHRLATGEAFFCLSTGRCGTQTLAQILATASNARVYHHPRPYLVAETLAAYHGEIDASSVFWYARGDVARNAWKDGLVFGELDHNMTPFSAAIVRDIPGSKFIVLVRNPWDFVRSGMRRGYFEGHGWDAGRLRPEAEHPDHARWDGMTTFEKVCWLWNETYDRIRGYLESEPEDRYCIVRFEDLTRSPELAGEIFQFLGLEGFDRSKIESILAQKLNHQIGGDFPPAELWTAEQHEILWKACHRNIGRFEYQDLRPHAGKSMSEPRRAPSRERTRTSEVTHPVEEPGSHTRSTILSGAGRVLFLEQAGISTGGHLNHIHAHWQERGDATYLKTSDLTEAKNAIEAADVVWLEWAGPLTAHVTNHVEALGKKPVICRLHGFEVFTDFPKKINWDVVDRLVFVADHKRGIFNDRIPNANVEKTVIRNGVVVDRFSIREHKVNTKKLVLLGHINARKGLPVLIQFFNELVKRDPEHHLYIRGDWQDARYEMGVRTMVHELQLESSITFVEEWIDDLDAWLADKSHILSFSLEESFHYAIGNGMAAGLKPVIHAWKESRAIWPEEFIFRNLDEFLELVLDDTFEPERYRQLLFEHGLTAERQISEFDRVIQEVIELYSSQPPADPPPSIPFYPSGDGSAQPHDLVRPSVTAGPVTRTPAATTLSSEGRSPSPTDLYHANKEMGLVLKKGEVVRDYMGLTAYLKRTDVSVDRDQLIDYLQFSFQKLLGPYFNASQIAQAHAESAVLILNRLNRDFGVPVSMSVDSGASLIHGLYHFLKEHLPPSSTLKSVDVPSDSETLARPEATDEVRNVYRALKTSFQPLAENGLVSLFVVHGSMSTLDFTPFSDIDTQLFLTDEAFASPALIEEIAKLISRNNLYLTTYDRLQHHGYFVATDLDRGSYPQPFLPVETIGRSTRIFGAETQEFYVRPLPFADRFAAWNMGHFFRSSCTARQFPTTPFDMKRFLSRFSMLPVLYLELIEDVYPYKGDVFQNWEQYFTPDTWKPFFAVTSARAKWNPDRGITFSETFYSQVFDFAELLLDRLNQHAA